MSFLPIVQRELLVAARRRTTLRVRWWTAALAMLSSLVILSLLESSSGRRGAGASLFGLIRWYAFLVCLFSGVFLGADCISAERRHGTLGLLFLSDLRGYDVVLGKLAALGLHAFYCLLALAPSAALCLLLGGVTGLDIWRTGLALGNALFFSMALGILVSVCSRKDQQSMPATLLLLLLFAAGLPALGALGGRVAPAAAWTGLVWASPSYAFINSAGGNLSIRSSPFWNSLCFSAAFAVGFLAFASWLLPRAWQESNKAPRAASPRVTIWQQPAARNARRARKRSELLTKNPIEWLTYQSLGRPWAAWAIVAAWGCVAILAVLVGGGSPNWGMVLVPFAMPFGFLLKLLFAIQATRFFCESRRNGALDFLLCTPLTDREIIRGQTRTLWRAFLLPSIVFGSLLLLPNAVQLVRAILAGTLDQAVSTLPSYFLTALLLLRFAADLLALCWFGMAYSLTARRPAIAPALTVLWVLILPSIFSFCWLDLIADLVFITWGVSQLKKDLRQTLTQGSAGNQPVLHLTGSAPPVIIR
jgi:ABC-type transport system involved in multi-copper enzyme maturation permease subunit